MPKFAVGDEPRRHPRPWVVDRLQFKEDYEGYLDRYRSHVYVIDLAERNARQVTLIDVLTNYAITRLAIADVESGRLKSVEGAMATMLRMARS